MNINDLTIGEAKELFSLFGNSQKLNSAKGLIIRFWNFNTSNVYKYPC